SAFKLFFEFWPRRCGYVKGHEAPLGLRLLAIACLAIPCVEKPCCPQLLGNQQDCLRRCRWDSGANHACRGKRRRQTAQRSEASLSRERRRRIGVGRTEPSFRSFDRAPPPDRPGPTEAP